MKAHYCEFDDNLYISDMIRDPALVKWKLRHGAGLVSVYLIASAQNGIDQLDLFNSRVLHQKYYRDNPVHVFGIAGSRRDAIKLVIKISEEASQCSMDGDLVGYLQRGTMCNPESSAKGPVGGN